MSANDGDRLNGGTEPAPKPSRAGSVKDRAKRAASRAKEGLVGTSPVDAPDAEELVGESRLEPPVTAPVSVPVLRYRTLFVRMAAGAVYVALNIAAVVLGKFPTALVMSFTAGVCCWEFFRLMRADAKSPNQLAGVFFACSMPIVTLVNTVYLVGVVFAMVAILGLWYIANQRVRITDVAITAFGAIYTGMTLSAIVGIRCSSALGNEGAVLLCIFVMASVWLNDSCAYLVGCRFGRHKMVPRISPQKSWEGLAGGIAGSLLVWLVAALFPATHVTVPVAVSCGLLCGAMGVIGDLVESRIKRGAGIKDSGNLIPGHGGLLDRSDSMLFVSISAYFLLRMMGVI